MSRRVGLVAALALPLAGCATFATNVKGSFACSAPDGICAPSSVIDDRALALIAGEDRDAAPPAPAPALLRSRGPVAEQVAQPTQKVLRIVFPAHVDSQGRYHELSVVRAVVDQGTWLAAADPTSPAPANLAEAVTVSSLAPLGTSNAAAVATADLGRPSAEAVRRARARAGVPPVSRETIASEVKAALAKPAANPPAGFPARVED